MSRSHYKNLIVVGNGFDIWQHIPSSYESFCTYYHEHIDDIIKETGLKYITVKDINGNEEKVSAVDIVYGSGTCSLDLKDEFFYNFESSLAEIDEQAVISMFGRSEEGLLKLEKTVEEAKVIIRKAFCDWIATFNIREGNSGYLFTDDCYIINFNYTDTVEKRFGVHATNDYHIHGSISEPSSIVFGHITHPETAFRELQERHFIESIDPETLYRE